MKLLKALSEVESVKLLKVLDFGGFGKQVDRTPLPSISISLSRRHPVSYACPLSASDARASAAVVAPSDRPISFVVESNSNPIEKRRVRMPSDPAIVAERKRIYIDELRKSPNKRHAAAVASAHLVNRNGMDGCVGEEYFRRQESLDPVFAGQVRDALSESLGRLEAALYDRAFTPDRRPIADKNGNIVGFDEQWRSANAIGLRILERHDDAWAPKSNQKVESNVTVNRGTDPQRSGLLLTADDVRRLPEDRRLLLSQLVDEMAQLADAEKAEQLPALPAPDDLSPPA